MSASDGGAILVQYGSPQLIDITYFNNTAMRNGGAICILHNTTMQHKHNNTTHNNTTHNNTNNVCCLFDTNEDIFTTTYMVINNNYVNSNYANLMGGGMCSVVVL